MTETVPIDRAANRLFQGHIAQMRKRLKLFGEPRQRNLVLLTICMLLLDVPEDADRNWVLGELDKIRHRAKVRELN